MAILQTYGDGYSAAAPAEVYVAGRNANIPLNGTQIGCINGHGASSTVITQVQTAEQPWAYPIQQSGIPLICSEAGGTFTWGNPDSIERIGDTWGFFSDLPSAGGYGASSGGVVLYGVSMGAIVVLNGAFNQGAQVGGMDFSGLIQGIVLNLPVLDLQWIVDNDPFGFSAGVIAAYGGTPDYSVYSPIEWGVVNATLKAIPMRIYYSTDDPICFPASTVAFAAAMDNCELISLGAVGHNGTTVPHDGPGSPAGFLADCVFGRRS